MVRVVGIDPGLAATGVGVVWGQGFRVAGFSYGQIKTAAEHPVGERLAKIYDGVCRVLKEQCPDLMVIEQAFSLTAYPKSGITLGKVLGILQMAAHQLNIPSQEVPVRKAKQVLTGSGAADKAQLERAVRQMLGADQRIKPDHASDALALALIGLMRQGPQNSIQPANQGRRP